jgi:GT2 family glycosyltransferase
MQNANRRMQNQDRQSCVDPLVTFLISSYNRRDVLLRTLDELREVDRRCGLVTETIVVDNASRDGTADAVASEFPRVQLIRQRRNTGACAKNAGLAVAAGAFVVFLDDDSFPTVGSIRKMVEHFLADESLGAAVFDVLLPDGSHESSAYPSVVIGCGTGFRRAALQQVGGLPTDFFMQAEEYDLSLRLLDSRWTIRRFDDLQVRHLKTAAARVPARTTRLDMRNNLMVATRYFPRHWMLPFAIDWARRYWWIAGTKGRRHQLAALRGAAEGTFRSLLPGHRRPIGLAAFEQFAMIVTIRRAMEQAKYRHRLQSIVLIDIGKNLLPFFLAAQASGIHIAAIADSKLSANGRKYRGVKVVSDDEASRLMCDASIITNISPAHAAQRTTSCRNSGLLVIDLFEQVQYAAIAA